MEKWEGRRNLKRGLGLLEWFAFRPIWAFKHFALYYLSPEIRSFMRSLSSGVARMMLTMVRAMFSVSL
jgi:hypothetical protein